MMPASSFQDIHDRRVMWLSLLWAQEVSQTDFNTQSFSVNAPQLWMPPTKKTKKRQLCRVKSEPVSQGKAKTQLVNLGWQCRRCQPRRSRLMKGQTSRRVYREVLWLTGSWQSIYQRVKSDHTPHITQLSFNLLSIKEVVQMGGRLLFLNVIVQSICIMNKTPFPYFVLVVEAVISKQKHPSIHPFSILSGLWGQRA